MYGETEEFGNVSLENLPESKRWSFLVNEWSWTNGKFLLCPDRNYFRYYSTFSGSYSYLKMDLNGFCFVYFFTRMKIYGD